MQDTHEASALVTEETIEIRDRLFERFVGRSEISLLSAGSNRKSKHSPVFGVAPGPESMLLLSTSKPSEDLVQEARELAQMPVRFEIGTQPTVLRVPWQRQYRKVLCGGLSIGGSGSTGTLGAIVQRNGERLILSCGHVLAPAGAAFERIFQPGPLDAKRGLRDIGEVIEFNSSLDAAIGRTDAPTAAFVHRIGRIRGVSRAYEKQEVEKSGRTTGHTEGQVDRTLLRLEVRGLKGSFTAFRIKGGHNRFSDRGDSGSVVVCSKTKTGLGLLFAGDPTYT